MKIKKAKDENEAWEIQDKREGLPRAWIQWKGTDVCMDVFCQCGHQGHFDGWFCYYIECPECGTKYMCNGHIELIELENEPAGGAKLFE